MSTHLVFAAAAAAALSALDVPGFFEAEPKVPKRFVGFGATMFAFGREAAEAPPGGLFSWPALTAPLESPLAFVPGLVLDATTTFFAAGWPLASPSRARLDPETSLRAPSTAAASEAEFFMGEPSLDPGFPFSCLRLLEAAALSRMVCARALTSAVPFFMNLGRSFATFVF